MKKILLFISMVSLTHASYQKADEYYKKGEYAKAVLEAKASKSEYSNSKLHLLWAKSAEALGESDEAMSAYERVAMLDEDSKEARVALLKIYQESSRDELAVGMYEELQRFELTQEERKAIEPKSDFDRGIFKAKASVALGYDSNINVSASAEDLEKFYGIATSKEESTLFAKVDAMASYFNDLGQKNGHYLRADLKLSYQNNFDASYYNMLVTGFDIGAGYKKSSYHLYIPIGYDKISYLDTDLLTQFRVTPKVTIPWQRDMLVNINAKYSSRTYDDVKYKAMADSSYGVGAGVTYVYDKNYIYLNANYETYSSSETIHFIYLDKSSFTTSLGVYYDIKNLFVTTASYTYRALSYDDITSTGAKREDSSNKVDVKLSYPYQDKIEFFVSESYVSNSSNHVPAQYTKNVMMFGISANY